MSRKRTFTAAELDVACEFDKRQIPVTEQNIGSVLDALTKPPQATEQPQRNKYDIYNEYHQAFPQVQVLPANHQYGEPIKRTHATTTKIDHNHTDNIRQVAQFTIPIGLGTAIITGIFVDFFPAVGIGVVVTGIVGYIASWQLATSANKYSDNAVAMAAQREETKQLRYQQETEQLRIQQHAKLSQMQIQQQRESQQLEQERLQQRQQARLAASQRQIEYRNRTVSETHYSSHAEPTEAFDDEHIDDTVYLRSQPQQSLLTVDNDVLKPSINNNKELLLDWLSRVYSSNAYNEHGVIKSARIDGVSTCPVAKRATQAYSISESDRQEIQSILDGFRGPSGNWILAVREGKTMLNIARYKTFEDVQIAIYNN